MPQPDPHAATTERLEGPRYVVTRIDGYSTSAARRPDDDAPPGVTFDVKDRLTGRLVGSFRSEDVAAGLPEHVRVNIAAFRAGDRVRMLEERDELAISDELEERPPA